MVEAAVAEADPATAEAPPPTTPTAEEPPATTPTATTTGQAATANGQGRPITAGEATMAMETQLDEVSQRARVRFKVGNVKATEGSTVVFAVPNTHYVDRCAEAKSEVEDALSAHFGQPVTLKIIVDDAAPPDSLDPAKIESTPTAPADDSMDDIGPVDELADASDQSTDGVERLTKAFPGSKVVEPKPE